MTSAVVPDGFTTWPHPSPVLDALGSLHAHGSDPLRAGFEVTATKVNARGFLHAGVVAAIGDVTIGHALSDRAGAPFVTVDLSCDLLGRAGLGDWVDIEIHPTKDRGRLVAGQAEMRRDGRTIAVVHALFMAVS